MGTLFFPIIALLTIISLTALNFIRAHRSNPPQASVLGPGRGGEKGSVSWGVLNWGGYFLVFPYLYINLYRIEDYRIIGLGC
jgi:hypothetical protein